MVGAEEAESARIAHQNVRWERFSVESEKNGRYGLRSWTRKNLPAPTRLARMCSARVEAAGTSMGMREGATDEC
jgi:hypothetical protein